MNRHQTMVFAAVATALGATALLSISARAYAAAPASKAEAPPKAAAPIKEIKGDQSPDEMAACAAARGAAESGQTKAAISTSRSNIKRPGMVVAENEGAGAADGTPQTVCGSDPVGR